MCSVETKNSIYEKFEKGLTPIDIIGTLNIPNESKVIYYLLLEDDTYEKRNKYMG